MAEHGRTDDTRAGDVGTDVPDPCDQTVADLAAQGQAKVIRRHQGADPQAIGFIRRQAQGQVSTQQARPDQHHQRREVQRTKRFPDFSHRRSVRLLESGESANKNK
ncbi:hypothetical protein D3C84_437560 [compost metagenome]